MKFNLHVQRTAWAGVLVLMTSGLFLTLATVHNGYGVSGALFGLLIILIIALPLTVVLMPSTHVEIKEKITYLYADDRAPEEFDTQA